jgi:TPR repeat protein
LKVADNFDVAEYKIGYFYEQGYGVPKDRTQALSWYHKAAKRGSTPAIAAMKELQD